MPHSAQPAPEQLIDRIYEAAVIPGAWPALLRDLGRAAGAKGGLIFIADQDQQRWTASPGEDRVYARYIEEGWHLRTDRIDRLRRDPRAGFLTDGDICTETELASLPLYTEFLGPLGYATAAATVVRGLANDEIVFSVEGFASTGAAQAAVGQLDMLRPHLARAGMLAARLGLGRAQSAVLALNQIGIAGAMLSVAGRLMAVNEHFNERLPQLGHDLPSGLRLRDRAADALLVRAIEAGPGHSASILVREGAVRQVLHLVPVRGEAREIFSNALALLLVSEWGAAPLPAAALIRSLLDLTPAEARLAHALAGGATLAGAAAAMRISAETARTHLKRIFAKTGIRRQADLIRLLCSIGPPGR